MLPEEVVRGLSVDAMAAFEVVGPEIVPRAQDLPRLAGGFNGRLHMLDREDLVLDAMFHQAWPGRDECRQVGKLTKLVETRHVITRAVEDVQDAVTPLAEVAADDAGLDAVVDGGSEECVHAAAGD